MVEAYAAFANDGHLANSYIIEEIRDIDGNTLYKANPQKGPQVMSDQTAFLTTYLMRSVIREPGGTAIRFSDTIPNKDIAVKTGTTNKTNYMAGSDPEITSVVSTFYDDSDDSDDDVNHPSAAKIWVEYKK